MQQRPKTPELAQLQVVNSQLRRAIDQIDEAVMILETGPSREPGPRIVFLNRALLSMSAYDYTDLLGRPIASLYDPERLPDLLARLPAVAQNNKTFQIRTELCCGDGKTKDCLWKISAARDDYGRAVNFVLTIKEMPAADQWSESPAIQTHSLPPIGEQVQLQVLDQTSEENSATAEEEAETVQIEKSRMYSLAMAAGGIAHDFKNVLTSIIANLSLAKLEAGVSSPLRRHIDDAAVAANGAKSLTDQLLTYARGGDNHKVDAANIGDLLADAAKLSTYGAQVECRLDIPDDLWSAEIDYTQITQVVNNLIINARQAMDESGVIQASLRNVFVRAFDPVDLKPGSYIKLSVIDHGCGIPEENLKDIFKSFYTTKEQGNGLGLATCFSIVLKHHGLITVDSKVGHGTEFNVFLPATGEVAVRSEEVVEGTIYRGEGSVLVVDDLADVRKVADALLSKLGYDVLLAESGEEALGIYKRRAVEGRAVNVVLMDMTLPGGMCGQDSAKEILRHDPFAKIVATSGYLDDSDSEQFTDLGFTSVVSKPYDLPKLSATIHRALRR